MIARPTRKLQIEFNYLLQYFSRLPASLWSWEPSSVDSITRSIFLTSLLESNGRLSIIIWYYNGGLSWYYNACDKNAFSSNNLPLYLNSIQLTFWTIFMIKSHFEWVFKLYCLLKSSVQNTLSISMLGFVIWSTFLAGRIFVWDQRYNPRSTIAFRPVRLSKYWKHIRGHPKRASAKISCFWLFQ